MSNSQLQEIHAAQGFSGSGSESALLRTDAECLFHTRSAFIPQFYARNAVRQKAESPVTAAVTGLFPIHAPGFEKVPLESFSLVFSSTPPPRGSRGYVGIEELGRLCAA